MKVAERRPFDINLTMQWNDIQELLTRSKRMWACAEEDGDYDILREIEWHLDILSKNIRKRLDKS
jgi:hypothetical protein